MIAASLIVAALVGLPFAPRAVVPVSSAGVSAIATPAAFNPAATARAHVATVTVTPTTSGVLDVVIESDTGVPVTTLAHDAVAVAGAPLSFTWDGAGAADGAYGAHVTLTEASGAVSEAMAPVAIDTTPPRVTLASIRPGVTRSGPVAVSTATADTSGASAIALEVLSQTDTPIGTLPVPVGADGRSGRLDWNLRLRKRLLLPGVFKLRTTITDGAGNVGTSPARPLRVNRAVSAEIIYSLPDAGNAVGLSFDDCTRGQDVLAIVRAFKAAKAHTTFFCNGVTVAGNAAAMRAALAAGDTIGSHTWSHPELPSLGYAAQRSQMQGDIDVWWNTAKAAPTPFFRPPYGLHNADTVRAAGDAGFRWIILWNVDPSDYLDPSPSALVAKVAGDVRPGSIVVMHANPNTARAVPEIIRAVRAKGLEPKSMDEFFGSAAYLSPASG